MAKRFGGCSIRILFFCFVFLGITGVGIKSNATELSLPVGVVFEHNFYNQFGLRASVAHNRILKGHPRITLMLTSSRLSAMAGKNVLKKENYLCNIGWFFRPNKLIDPFLSAEIGFTRYSIEYEELFGMLDNSAPLFNVRIGIASTLWKEKIRLSIDGGYCFVHSSIVLPLVWGIGIDFDIIKGVLP